MGMSMVRLPPQLSPSIKGRFLLSARGPIRDAIIITDFSPRVKGRLKIQAIFKNAGDIWKKRAPVSARITNLKEYSLGEECKDGHRKMCLMHTYK